MNGANITDDNCGIDSEIAELERRLREAKCERKSKQSAERMRRLHADPEFKAQQSERMRRLNADPEFKAQQSEGMRRLNADPEFKAREKVRKSERMRRLNADPEFKAQQSERMRRLNADPEFKAREKVRKSERMRRLHADPESNPLAALTPAQRDDYNVLVRKGGYSREEALQLVLAESATMKSKPAQKPAPVLTRDEGELGAKYD